MTDEEFNAWAKAMGLNKTPFRTLGDELSGGTMLAVMGVTGDPRAEPVRPPEQPRVENTGE